MDMVSHEIDKYRNKLVDNIIPHWKREINDFLNLGKTCFILLDEEFKVAEWVSSYLTNYDCFFPNLINNLTLSQGEKVICQSQNKAIREFYEEFNNHMKFKVYFNTSIDKETIFTDRNNRTLGKLIKSRKGYIVAIPYIEKGYTEEFSETLYRRLINIDRSIRSNSEKTPPLEWVEYEEYEIAKATEIENQITHNNNKIEQLQSENEDLAKDLEKENIIMGLLYEQGKPLENAVSEALRILGYTVEHFVDGDLELDQLISNSEGQIFIGECEGKETKAINLTKMRQLFESRQRYFEKMNETTELSEVPMGILFGNAKRLAEPNARGEIFTKTCINNIRNENIALVSTVDLFWVVQYLKEHNDDNDFRAQCRNAIESGKGKIVEFPTNPKTS